MNKLPEKSDIDDLRYFKLVSLAIAVTLAFYWGLQYLRHSLMDYLIGTVFGGTVAIIALAALLRGVYTKQLSSADLHPVVMRYRDMLVEIESFDSRKKALLQSSLVPQLQELIEDKLPELIDLRDRYEGCWKRCSPVRLQEEIKTLEEKIENESDMDIRRALKRNLSIAQSTKENYANIEKTMKLYELQIASIDKHLENLVTKLHILDPDDDIKSTAEGILRGIHYDIDDLEKALIQMDDLRADEMVKDE